MRKQKKKRYLFIIFLVALVSIITTALIFYAIRYSEVRRIDMQITVGDLIGFNLDNNSLQFGTAMPGGSSSRSMIFNNNFEFPIKIEITFEPKRDIFFFFERTKTIPNEWISVSENNFILQPEQEKSIKFTISLPKDVKYGDYTSQALIFVRKA